MTLETANQSMTTVNSLLSVMDKKGKILVEKINTCLTGCPTLEMRIISSSRQSFPGDFFPQLSRVIQGTGT